MRSVLLSSLLLALSNLSAAELPSISVSREGGQTKIFFSGELQGANTVAGPWTPITNAVSPHVETNGSSRFFRAYVPTGIFESADVATLAVIGPLQTHFELAFAGMPDGIFPPVREKPYFAGTISIAGQNIPVDLRVRGNSSLQECPFPKLKFKVAKAHRPGTPFEEAHEVKIGTHCAEGGRGPIGRLREETAAYREALAYEVMNALGFVAPKVRRARIDYRDISPANQMGEVGWDLTRAAFLLEDVEVLAARLGGKALKDEEAAGLFHANFDEQTLADLHLLHALLGNWDYALSQAGRELWNTEVIELPNGTRLPVAADFDLASFVTERVRLEAPWDYHPELPDLERQARFKVEELIKQAGADRAQAAITRFKAKQSDLQTLVANALVDEIGRTNAAAHLAAFYAALDPLRKEPQR
jgi:hypothetical protein